MPVSDRLVGTVGFSLAVFIYIYYTAWALVTPFIDAKAVWFHSLFPDRWWAFAVPTALLVVGLTCIALFVGMVSMKRMR